MIRVQRPFVMSAKARQVWTEADHARASAAVHGRWKSGLGHKVWFARMKNIFVGNLPFSATEADLNQLFSQHGKVDRVAIIIDRETGRSRGFGFVEMGNDAEADAAINALNGTDFGGRPLKVNEAQPREQRSGGGGGGGGWSRGGGGGGGGGRW